MTCVVVGCSVGSRPLCDAHGPLLRHDTKLRLLRAFDPDENGEPIDTPQWRAAVALVNAKVEVELAKSEAEH